MGKKHKNKNSQGNSIFLKMFGDKQPERCGIIMEEEIPNPNNTEGAILSNVLTKTIDDIKNNVDINLKDHGILEQNIFDEIIIPEKPVTPIPRLLGESGITDTVKSSPYVNETLDTILKGLEQKNLSISLSKAMEILATDNLYETGSYYILSDWGQYGSDLSFTFTKDNVFELLFIKDDNYIRSMGLSWTGYAYCLFGNFWESPRGTKCFTPKSRNDAEDVLIKIDWHKDSRNNNNVGILKDGDTTDYLNVLYHHRTKDSGILTGSDYIVLPKDYRRIKNDEEI